MASVIENKSQEYRSPHRKLISFFRKSRDNWKRKCQDSKERCRYYANQSRAAERSRDHWRAQAKAAKRRVQALERELAQQKTQ